MSREKLTLAIFSCIALNLFHDASGLRCYSCHHWVDRTSSSRGVDDGGDWCADGAAVVEESQPIECGRDFDICVHVRTVEKGGRVSYVRRSCAMTKGDVDFREYYDSDGCLTTAMDRDSDGRQGEKHISCLCTEDACNTAGNKAGSLALLLVVLKGLKNLIC